MDYHNIRKIKDFFKYNGELMRLPDEICPRDIPYEELKKDTIRNSIKYKRSEISSLSTNTTNS